MRKYTVSIRHFKKFGQKIEDCPTEILEFERPGLSRRDMENIYLALKYGFEKDDLYVTAYVEVDGYYNFLVSMWRTWKNDELKMVMNIVRRGRIYPIRIMNPLF